MGNVCSYTWNAYRGTARVGVATSLSRIQCVPRICRRIRPTYTLQHSIILPHLSACSFGNRSIRVDPTYPMRSLALSVRSDCAVCAEGYGTSVINTCLSCDSSEARLLISAAVILSMVVVLLSFSVGVLFLVGGLHAVDPARTSSSATRKFPMVRKLSSTMSVTTRNVFMSRELSRVWPTHEATFQERRDVPEPGRGTRGKHPNSTIARAFNLTWERQRRDDDDSDADDCQREPQPTIPGSDDPESAANTRPSGASSGVGAGNGMSDFRGRQGIVAERPVIVHSAVAGAGAGGARGYRIAKLEAKSAWSDCCGRGDAIRRWGSRLPLGKLKILVLVWQILASFSSITGVEFPASYATFLAWVNVVNLDLGLTFSASCILPPVNFYGRLLVATLTPLVLAAGLVLTYRVAKRRADIGWAGVIARRDAWSRHVSAGLLLTFLVRACSVTFHKSKVYRLGGESEKTAGAMVGISCSWYIF